MFKTFSHFRFNSLNEEPKTSVLFGLLQWNSKKKVFAPILWCLYDFNSLLNCELTGATNVCCQEWRIAYSHSSLKLVVFMIKDSLLKYLVFFILPSRFLRLTLTDRIFKANRKILAKSFMLLKLMQKLIHKTFSLFIAWFSTHTLAQLNQ